METHAAQAVHTMQIIKMQIAHIGSKPTAAQTAHTMRNTFQQQLISDHLLLM
jgi:hypothetical protein